jgi:hypothetical protein
MFGIEIVDLDEDGNLDIMTIGNSYASEILTGYYDAGIGNFLQGDGKGNFKAIPVTESGFFVDGDAKAMAQLTLKNGNQLLLVTQNRDSLKVFKKSDYTNQEVGSFVRIEPKEEYAIIEFTDGRKRKQEFYLGSGYLSSSSRTIIKGRKIASINLFSRKDSRKISSF